MYVGIEPPPATNISQADFEMTEGACGGLRKVIAGLANMKSTVNNIINTHKHNHRS